MTRTSSQRGLTLIECMVAMVVMLVGAVGTLGLHSVGISLNSDARHVTRATAVAQDLLNQMETWSYDDARLGNDLEDNDADIGDSTLAFEDAAPTADHDDDDLGANWLGIPTASLGGEYQRYWNVAYPDDSNSNDVTDAVRIAAVVRWRHGGGWRRIVLYGLKPNPVER